MHKALYSLHIEFQANQSIDYALVILTETERDTLDNKRFGCVIFIDLQKVLDIVIIIFRCQILSTMVLVDVHCCGLSHMFLTESNTFL